MKNVTSNCFMPMKPRLMVCACRAAIGFISRKTLRLRIKTCQLRLRMANWLTGGLLDSMSYTLAQEHRRYMALQTAFFRVSEDNRKFSAAVKRLTGMDASLLQEFQTGASADQAEVWRGKVRYAGQQEAPINPAWREAQYEVHFAWDPPIDPTRPYIPAFHKYELD